MADLNAFKKPRPSISTAMRRRVSLISCGGGAIGGDSFFTGHDWADEYLWALVFDRWVKALFPVLGLTQNSRALLEFVCDPHAVSTRLEPARSVLAGTRLLRKP